MAHTINKLAQHFLLKKKMEPAGENNNPFLLSVEDFKQRNIKIDPNWTGFECLMAVVEVASAKVVKGEKHMEKQKRLMGEKALKRIVSEGSVSEKKNNFSEMNDDEEWDATGQHGRSKNLERRKKDSRKGKRMKYETCRDQTVDNIHIPEDMRKVIESMKGDNITLVIEKYLYPTDMNNHHGRMSVPLNQIRADFLTQQEKEYLDQDGEMQVVFVQPSLAKCVMNFKRWRMEKEEGSKSSSSYILKTFWNDVKISNGLKVGDKVQLWSFRVDERLCLALVKVSETTVDGTLQVKPC